MNAAIRPYLNLKEVPQLFVVSSSPKFNDPKHYPWTTGWVPSNSSEGRIYGAYVVKNRPDAKIAVLYQSDDFGRDFLNGFKAALGDKASQIVATESYEVADPTADSSVVSPAASGADVFSRSIASVPRGIRTICPPRIRTIRPPRIRCP
jgi:branched-chain amino acid transport system substrate-binding protein